VSAQQAKRRGCLFIAIDSEAARGERFLPIQASVCCPPSPLFAPPAIRLPRWVNWNGQTGDRPLASPEACDEDVTNHVAPAG